MLGLPGFSPRRRRQSGSITICLLSRASIILPIFTSDLDRPGVPGFLHVGFGALSSLPCWSPPEELAERLAIVGNSVSIGSEKVLISADRRAERKVRIHFPPAASEPDFFSSRAERPTAQSAAPFGPCPRGFNRHAS